MDQERDNIRFNALRNALYHTARRLYFERANRLVSFVVVLLGASAMSNVVGRFGLDQIWLGATIAVFGAVQLVFDFGGQARDHQQLQRDYYHLQADIDASTKPSIKQNAEWSARMTRIYCDEPPVLRAIDAKAYNDAIDALDWPRDERLFIPLAHRAFGWLFSYDGYEYKKIKERQRKAA